MGRTKKLLLALALSVMYSTSAMAQFLDIGPGSTPAAQQNTPYWNIYRNTSSQSITSSNTPIIFNAATYDSNSSCNLSNGICTIPTGQAGLYSLYCSFRVDSATGPSINGLLAEARIVVNGSFVSLFDLVAQVTTIPSAVGYYVSTSALVKLNAGDTVSCNAASGGTSASVIQGQGQSFFTAYRTGAQ